MHQRPSLFLRAFVWEFRQFSGSKSIVILVIGGVILYAVLYNFMYFPQVVRQVPIALVDEDNTPQSRAFARHLSATPQVAISLRYAHAEEARAALQRGEVEGVVQLPRGYSRRAMHPAETPPIYIMWGSTASLLTYAAVQEAVTLVAMNQLSQIAPSASARTVSVEVVGLPLYNTTGGYGTYLIPAVLMVILFQTMLMVVSIRLGTDYTSRYRAWQMLLTRSGGIQDAGVRPAWKQVARLVGGRLLVYVSIYAVMALFVVALVPRLFDLPHEGDALTLGVLMAEYLVATAAFALALAPLFRHPEEGLVYIAFFSVGYLFLSGVSYPLESMPWPWQVVRILFPVCPATMAYVEVNTLGASLGDISTQLLWLSLQAKVYISVAICGHFYLLKSAFHYGNLKKCDSKQIKSPN
jgi:hypothetical protein